MSTLHKALHTAIPVALTAGLGFAAFKLVARSNAKQTLSWQQTSGKTYKYHALVTPAPNNMILAAALQGLGGSSVHIDNDPDLDQTMVQWIQTPKHSATLSQGTMLQVAGYTLELISVSEV